jgi:predicted RNA-binding protein with PUA-like domain
MKVGDVCLFYHSNEGKAVVGISEVVREGYPDPRDAEWTAVDVAPVRALEAEVTLADMRDDPALANMALLRRPRISVTPVTRDEYDALLAAAKAKSKGEGAAPPAAAKKAAPARAAKAKKSSAASSAKQRARR